ncbi:MAG: hypothetical protein ACRDOB_15045, partial [Streptosporangiaceae bacterium]
LMALATVLAIVIVTARWLFQRHAGRGGQDRSMPTGPGQPEPETRPGWRDTRETGEWGGPGAAATQRMPRPPLSGGLQRTDPPAGRRPDEPSSRTTGPRPDQRSSRTTGPRPGARPGPYNFSSGA